MKPWIIHWRYRDAKGELQDTEARILSASQKGATLYGRQEAERRGWFFLFVRAPIGEEVTP